MLLVMLYENKNYEKQGDLACLLESSPRRFIRLCFIFFIALYRHDLDVFHSLLSHISITRKDG